MLSEFIYSLAVNTSRVEQPLKQTEEGEVLTQGNDRRKMRSDTNQINCLACPAESELSNDDGCLAKALLAPP